MKKLLISLVLALTAFSPLFTPGVNVASAASVPTNTAIRGTTSSTVFWYANDGKRYVFPNATAYYSWFPSFDNVRTISDAELYSISIGGNVTYRPGAKLVKINTDPKVYAVARGAVLRHVTSEYLAERLYGFDWRTDVHDIADVYFTNYTVGTPIYSESDYHVSNEYNGVSTPSDSLRGMTGTTQIGDLTLSASRTSINPGEAVTLSVSNAYQYVSGYRVEIYDTRNNGLVRTCNLPTSVCDVTVFPQRNGNESSVQYFAALRDTNNNTIKSGYSPVIYFGGSMGNAFSSGSSSLEANRTTANAGETVTLTARAWNLNTTEANIRMELYRESNNALVDTCWDRTNCTFNVTVTNDGSNAVRFYVIVKNDANEQIPAAYSGRITVNGSQTGTLVLNANRTTVMSGETITLSTSGASAWNTSRITFVNEQNGTTIANCYSISSCSQNVTVTGYNGETIRYRAEARDWNGSILATAYATVYVNGSSYNNGTLSLTADRTSINAGEAVTLTATYDRALELHTSFVIRDTDGINVATRCDRTCSVTVYPDRTKTYVAEIWTGSGTWSSKLQSSNTVTVHVNGSSYNNGTLSLTADRTSIMSGQPVVLTANLAGTLPSGGYIQILAGYPTYSINVLKTCYDRYSCSVTVYPTQTSGYAYVQYRAIAYNSNGSQLSGTNNVLSQQIYFTGSGSSNDGTNYINGLVLNADRTSVNAGELVRLTANAFHTGTWSYAGNRIEIWNVNTNQLLRTCYDTATCTLEVYPQAQSSVNLTAQYQARIYDRNGSLAMSQYSPVIYVSGYNGSNQNGSISGSGVTTFAPTENLRVNRNIYLTSAFTGSNIAMADAKVEIYAEHLSTPVATCYGSYTCSVSYPTGSSPMTTRVYARLSNRYNASTWVETSRVSMTTTW